MTPGSTEEDHIAETIAGEMEARIELENDLCPPCYPAYLKVPLTNVPAEYKTIVEYFEEFKTIEGQALMAQRNDWRRFRTLQTRLHAFWEHRGRSLVSLEDRVQSVRQKHGLTNGRVQLQFDPKNQTQLQTWTEFQYFHLQTSERLERELATAERELDEFYTRTEKPRPLQISRLEYHKRLIARHPDILEWIERTRKEFELQETSRNGDNNPHTTLQAGICGERRSRRIAARRNSQTLDQKQSKPNSKLNNRKPKAVKLDRLTKTRSGRISKPPTRWVPP